MIKSITIETDRNGSLELELTRPGDTGFIVKLIEGLGPAKAKINVSKFATKHGGKYNSSRIDERNITMELEFLQTATETIEDLRYKSYKYFPEGEHIGFIVETDTRRAKIEGYVESNEPDIFSQNEGCNISIVCPDPFFKSVYKNTYPINTVDPLFEFEFEADYADEPDNAMTLIMGNVNDSNSRIINYSGDYATGVNIYVFVREDITSNLTISNLTTGETLVIDIDKLSSIATAAGMNEGIKSGDIISINTYIGSKSISLARGADTINILNCLKVEGGWITLVKGDNEISYISEDAETALELYIESSVIYHGV